MILGHGQTRNVAQYPLHNMTYAPAKFEAAMSNSLGGNKCFHVDNMKELFQDIHIGSIMTFLRQIHLLKKNLVAIFKIIFCFTFVSDHNTDFF